MMRSCLISLLLLGSPVFAEPSDETSAEAQAREVVDADAKLVDVEVQRVSDLKVAWDRAVANGHPDEAGRLAVAHAKALAAQRNAEAALRTARAYLAQLRASRAPGT
jgi:hypothetical protein